MKAIYTVITNNYDEIPKAPIYKGWDVILFTDIELEDNKGWEVRKLNKSDNPLLQSRDIKIRSHVHLKEYDLVCYIDGNQKLLKEPPNKPTWYTHARRNNIFEEAKQIIINGRFEADKINEQIDYYKNDGYEDCGLYLNGFFVRDHSKDINKLHERWYKETSRFVPRDQLTLPYSIWYTGIEPKNIISYKTKEETSIVLKGH
jgi:hypothetical protein